MRLLFIKGSLAWPRATGHDVHCYGLMKALGRAGHSVSLATVAPIGADAVRGLSLSHCFHLGDLGARNGHVRSVGWLRERFREYYGVDPLHMGAVRWAAEAAGAEAVVGVGLDVLPYLADTGGVPRVWYAADEWVWHHVSQTRLTQPATWNNLLEAAIKGAYERAHARLLDRAWVVSAEERRAMRWLAGIRRVDVVANGVDIEEFRPASGPEAPRTAVFWGRLDYGPNIQALEWFCRRVWSRVRDAADDARFTIVGFRPSVRVQRLAAADGISLRADVPDLNAEAGGHALVVLPFVSGGGIKNKLLEAASMAKAIVCTPQACRGLRGPSPLPLVVAHRPDDWVEAILTLWIDEARRRALGMAARRWVQQHHSWESAAAAALASVQQSLAHRNRT